MKKNAIILGGGLWGGLLAYRWSTLYPEVPFVLVEAGDSFGGNHTWSFHESDITPEALAWLGPFIEKSWPRYDVKFPEVQRTVELPYHSVTSEKFNEVLRSSLPESKYQLSMNGKLEEYLASENWVIDARGLFNYTETGWQKFLGHELELEVPHGITNPVLMDALLPQTDGFRFLYLLPFSETRILVELTSYSNEPSINEEEYSQVINDLVTRKEWKIRSIKRVEKAALPIPISEVTTTEAREVVTLGGIFHDTTGYSLPDAVKAIELLLSDTPSYQSFSRKIAHYKDLRKAQRSFYRLLNRFIFRASPNEERYRMLQFFYKHNTDLISKFYSGRMTSIDRIKFFIGRPPVSIGKAIKEVMK